MNTLAKGLLLSLLVFQLVPAAVAQSLEGRLVTAVSVEGLERVSEQVAQAQLEVQAGQEYNPRAVARDIRRLHDMGYFARIKADARPVGADGLAIVYVVEEKQIIESIRIVGNRKFRDRAIRGVLNFREGDSFVTEAFQTERQSILDFYEGKGYANTVVDAVAERTGQSRLRLIYTIQEGRRARIASVTIAGNENLSDRQLRGVMATKRGFWFLGGKYDEMKFENDLQSLVNKYGDFGHLEADIVKTDVFYRGDGRRMDITIHVDEGPVYHVEELRVANNLVYDIDELYSVINVHDGHVHNRGQVLADAELIQQGYQESGYVNARVVPQVTLDRESKTTNVIHQVSEGEMKYIREITITGNEITKDEVIRRHVSLLPGERFDGNTLRMSQRSIQNTQYFDDVRIALQDVPGDDMYTDVNIDVEEGRTGNFIFGAGFNSEQGLGGFAELRLRNFDIANWPSFSGGGQEFDARINIGQRSNQFRIGFTDPEFLGNPYAFGFDIYSETQRFDDSSNFREGFKGAQLRLGKALSNYVTVTAALRLEQSNIQSPSFFLNPDIRRDLGKNTNLALRLSITRDTVDNPRNITSGSRHTGAFEVAGLADYEYIKLEHDSEWYWSISKNRNWVLNFRTREGWATGYGSDRRVPLSERFYAGGTQSIRGYDWREVGPRQGQFFFGLGDKFSVGGELYWVYNVEVKYKVSDIMRLYMFHDGGAVWSTPSDIDFGEMRYSVGVGVGFDVPFMGPIRVDYGFPLNPDKHQGSGRLHLQAGFNF